MKPWYGITAAVFLAFMAITPARALDPARNISQYKHTRWTIDDGAPAAVSVIAQGRDGYLWVGGADGLYRFDGLRFELIPRKPTAEAASSISAMLVSRTGDVWVGYSTGGTAVYRNGTLHDVPMPSGDYVMKLVEAPDRGIWAILGRKDRQLFRFKDGRWAEVGASLGFPSSHLIDILVARDGTILVSTNESGVLVLQPGAPRFVRADDRVVGHAALSEDRDGNIWLSDKRGTRTIHRPGMIGSTDARIPYPTPEARRKALSIFDRDGNLWGITEDGIFRLRRPSADGAPSTKAALDALQNYQAKDGLTSDSSRSILEDREGNIWVSTTLGLDRFRASTVVTEPMLTKRAFWNDVLLGASDGTVYVGESDAIYRIRPTAVPEVMLKATELQAICEGPDGAIWIVLQDRVVRMAGGKTVSFLGPGKTDQGVSDCAVDSRNQIWLSAIRDGLFRLVGNSWQRSMVPPALGGFPPGSLFRRRDGKMLVAFEEQSLAWIDAANRPHLLIRPGKWPGRVRTIFQSSDGLLIGGAFGIGEIRDGRIRFISSRRVTELRNVSGLVQTPTGQTWASTSGGPVLMSTASLKHALADPHAPIAIRQFDFRDGLPGLPGRDDIRSVVKGGDGRIWFGVSTGTVWIDSKNLLRNTLPPPVRISAITAGDTMLRDPVTASLKAGTRSIKISFAALSLSIPERVRVRYQLVGEDQGWVDPGMRRDAFYTNLRPGHYVFQVIAANNDGVWNREGAKLEFDIAPTFLQSNWFLALCIGGAALLLWAGYRVRVRQLTGKMRERLEERLAERERIARDLHDTLLQGFQGLILRFQSVANEIPENLRARGLLGQALDSADRVLSDGRDSVRLLRTVDDTDLAHALSMTAERMRLDYPAEFTMVVEGAARKLHPVVRDEVCRIGEEAVINAFQHAHAKLIEVAIAYDASGLRLGIRDDGVGIPPELFARGGRMGHFGLIGMRERAQQIGAEFSVSSRPGAGTEVRLHVSGKVAYQSARRRAFGQWLGLYGLAERGS